MPGMRLRLWSKGRTLRNEELSIRISRRPWDPLPRRGGPEDRSPAVRREVIIAKRQRVFAGRLTLRHRAIRLGVESGLVQGPAPLQDPRMSIRVIDGGRARAHRFSVLRVQS